MILYVIYTGDDKELLIAGITDLSMTQEYPVNTRPPAIEAVDPIESYTHDTMRADSRLTNMNGMDFFRRSGSGMVMLQLFFLQKKEENIYFKTNDSGPIFTYRKGEFHTVRLLNSLII